MRAQPAKAMPRPMTAIPIIIRKALNRI
jgi:hypothetical protein